MYAVVKRALCDIINEQMDDSRQRLCVAIKSFIVLIYCVFAKCRNRYLCVRNRLVRLLKFHAFIFANFYITYTVAHIEI